MYRKYQFDIQLVSVKFEYDSNTYALQHDDDASDAYMSPFPDKGHCAATRALPLLAPQGEPMAAADTKAALDYFVPR